MADTQRNAHDDVLPAVSPGIAVRVCVVLDVFFFVSLVVSSLLAVLSFAVSCRSCRGFTVISTVTKGNFSSRNSLALYCFVERVCSYSILFWCLLLVIIYHGTKGHGASRCGTATEWERDIVVYRSRVELPVDVSRWILSFASNDPSGGVHTYTCTSFVQMYIYVCVHVHTYVMYGCLGVSPRKRIYILRKSCSSERAVNWFPSLSLSLILPRIRELEIVRRQREVHCLRSIVSLRLDDDAIFFLYRETRAILSISAPVFVCVQFGEGSRRKRYVTVDFYRFSQRLGRY